MPDKPADQVTMIPGPLRIWFVHTGERVPLDVLSEWLDVDDPDNATNLIWWRAYAHFLAEDGREVGFCRIDMPDDDQPAEGLYPIDGFKGRDIEDQIEGFIDAILSDHPGVQR